MSMCANPDGQGPGARGYSFSVTREAYSKVPEQQDWGQNDQRRGAKSVVNFLVGGVVVWCSGVDAVQ
ncbi:hypothetical protein E4U42_007608 [Claviceps africana]|uniref:Uncharacterized protein n=1 Tax=Claviceps africana TaxID=83212 RepID=A0A8K0NIE8_9HYPO|nr:hypothetical protein E4U42_007608 [Claviceps africana]